MNICPYCGESLNYEDDTLKEIAHFLNCKQFKNTLSSEDFRDAVKILNQNHDDRDRYLSSKRKSNRRRRK